MIKKNILIISLIIILIILIGGISMFKFRGFRNFRNDEDLYQYITPEDAKIRIDSGEKLIILDVRSEEEYKEGYIKNALNIPVDVIEDRVKSEITDKNVPILVYCRSGSRSSRAATTLVQYGYKNVYNLGGIISWKYEIEK